ncbi:PLDc_N domain-containing protein, partial [Streptomyces daliensis]|nr:PLDc_N domain-containing protein [Streptomyces daliensis]
MLRYLPFLLILAVWIYAFIDCLNTPEKEVRKLPKVVWVIIILLFGQVLLGPIAWFAVGRPRKNAPYGATKPQERRWVAPDDNPDFLKSLGDDKTKRDPSPAPQDDPASTPDPAPSDASRDQDDDAHLKQWE